MIRKFISFILVLIAAFAVVVTMQPSELLVSESALIEAPAEKIFKQINNFHSWESWSPWAKIDPNATEKYDGPVEGEGSSYSWSGNKEAGAGSMIITKSHPSDLIEIKLDFTSPYKAENIVKFELKPESNRTLVTWSMQGNNSFIGKAICLVFGCKKMISEQYIKGLSNLKSLVEPNQINKEANSVLNQVNNALSEENE